MQVNMGLQKQATSKTEGTSLIPTICWSSRTESMRKNSNKSDLEEDGLLQWCGLYPGNIDWWNKNTYASRLVKRQRGIILDSRPREAEGAKHTKPRLVKIQDRRIMGGKAKEMIS